VKEPRLEKFCHGTTMHRARQLVENEAFDVSTETFFAIGYNRDLAVWFARRKANNNPREGGPALVVVGIPAETFSRLRQRGDLIPKSFSEGDRPELRRQVQWLATASGIETINRHAEEWNVQAVH